jgi:shikimate kinase
VKRHVVLVGLPGAGKSTVGRLAAALLGAEFDDTDLLVSRAASRSIPDIFAREGEAGFRRLERAAMAAALDRPARIVAAGGGWASEPGNLEAAEGRGLIIYLSCAPETAARRTAGSAERPLLPQDSVAAIVDLLHRRLPFYRRAHREIVTDGCEPGAVAADVVALARSHGGW